MIILCNIMVHGMYRHYFLDFRPEEYDLKRVDVEVFENVTTQNSKRYSFIDVRAYFYSMIKFLSYCKKEFTN